MIPAASNPALSQAGRLALAARDIKLSHSVFALPFALLGAFLARPAGESWTSSAAALAVVIWCMVSARTWAMLANRLLDRRFDAANPRTARRAFASGSLTPGWGWAAAGAAAGLFLLGCAGFWFLRGNPWPTFLGGPVLAWIAFYSLTKRFTALCHAVLGASLAASPLAAAIAFRPASVGLGIDPLGLVGPAVPALFPLAGMVLCWVAGFDIIYALQDIDFDRSRGLRSIPARLGPAGAVWVSRALHAGAFALLVLAWKQDARLGPVFGAAVGLVGALLVAEHVILARRGKAGLQAAFFTVNGVVSLVVGAAGIADVLAG